MNSLDLSGNQVTLPVPEEPVVPKEVADKMAEYYGVNFEAWDDTKKGSPPLDAKKVYRARLEELDWLKKRAVFKQIGRESCRERV